MCGIAGVINLTNDKVQQSSLHTMSKLLSHRGPDDSGSFLEQSIGLIHTRLSIQDLSNAAHQPMQDHSTKSCIVFNGEIYNFTALKAELIKEGIEFSSTGDTEVLLKCCLYYGVPQTLTKLNGMFSFAFWDGITKKLWLARDRMGIKPFYYCQIGSQIFFASEIKAILPFLPVLKANNPALLNTLSGKATWEPNTLFENIIALNPGHYLELTSGQYNDLTPIEYFSPLSCVDESTYQDYNKSSMPEITEEFTRLMSNSVDLHAVSDAPIAALLSGGLDSSLISVLAKKTRPNLALYHADIIGQQSEKVHAEIVAEHLNLPFISQAIDKYAYADNLVKTTFHHEFPSSYHANDVPFQLIAQRASKDGIKVLLTGEGADELFLGYNKASNDILSDRIQAIFRQIPGLAKVNNKIESLMKPNFESTLLGNLATRGHAHLLNNKAQQAYSFINDPVEKNALIQSQMYLKAHLNSLLQRNDRMGMMHGLESRIPFLENEVVKFALNLPIKFKRPHSLYALLRTHRQRTNKLVVRNAAHGLIPSSIINRKKVGFPISPTDYLTLQSSFFKDGFIQQNLSLSAKDMSLIFTNLPNNLRWKFFSTELFGRIFFMNESHETLKEQICSYLK